MDKCEDCKCFYVKDGKDPGFCLLNPPAMIMVQTITDEKGTRHIYGPQYPVIGKGNPACSHRKVRLMIAKDLPPVA